MNCFEIRDIIIIFLIWFSITNFLMLVEYVDRLEKLEKRKLFKFLKK